MRQHHRSASPFEEEIGFSRAVRQGQRILVSGTAPIAADGSSLDAGPYEQAHRCFTIAVEAIEALGGTRHDVVRTRMFVVDAAEWRDIGRAHGEFFRGVNPAATMVVVAGLLDPLWRVEIEVEALLQD